MLTQAYASVSETRLGILERFPSPVTAEWVCSWDAAPERTPVVQLLVHRDVELRRWRLAINRVVPEAGIRSMPGARAIGTRLGDLVGANHFVSLHTDVAELANRFLTTVGFCIVQGRIENRTQSGWPIWRPGQY